MKNTLRILLLFVLSAVLMLTVISCNKKSVSEDDFGNDGYIVVDGKRFTPDYIMKIGDINVTLQEYRYHYLNNKNDYDGGNNDVWKEQPEYIGVLQDTVEKSLIELYSVRSLCKEAGIESDIDAVYDAIDEYKDQEGLSSSQFEEGLKTHYLTEALYAYVLEGYQLYDKLYDHYFTGDGEKVMSDAEVLDFAEGYYYHVKHILVYPNTSMPRDEYDERLDTILERAQTEEDFDALVAEYSNDAAMPEFGYYFTDGDKGAGYEEYEKACSELEIGEVSDLIKTGDGCYVIKRLPVEEDDVKELRDIIYNRKYADMIENKIRTISVEYLEGYEYIAPTTLK